MARGARIVAPGSAVCLAVDACSAGEVDTDDCLKVAVAGEPDQLDPHNTSAHFSCQTLENVYDALVQPEENLEMQPALAESWEVGENEPSWTFHLRKDVTLHDGSEFTAEGPAPERPRPSREHLAACIRLPVVQASGRGASHGAEIRTGPARTAPWAGGPPGGSSGGPAGT